MRILGIQHDKADTLSPRYHLANSNPSPRAANLKPGLVGEYFKQLQRHPQECEAAPRYGWISRSTSVKSVGSSTPKLSQNFTVRWTGQLLVEKSGEYGFATASDDGSRLYIDGRMVVDNGGSHSWAKKTEVQLSFGTHRLEVRLDQGGGGAGCITY